MSKASKTESPTERAKRLKAEIEARISVIANDEYLNACRGKWNYRAWPSGSTRVVIVRKKALGLCLTIGSEYTHFSLDEAENYLRALSLGCLTRPTERLRSSIAGVATETDAPSNIDPAYDPAIDVGSREVADAAHAEALAEFNRAKERLDRITAIRDALSPKVDGT